MISTIAAVTLFLSIVYGMKFVNAKLGNGVAEVGCGAFIVAFIITAVACVLLWHLLPYLALGGIGFVLWKAFGRKRDVVVVYRDQK